LTWFRELEYIDNGNAIIDSLDSYNVVGALDNLDLSLLLNGNPIARSASLLDNLEHVYFQLPESGNYTLRVSRLDVPNSGSETLFGLAWNGITAVPEPSTALTLVPALLWLGLVRRR
jgi:hypothetical protein